MHSIDSKYHKVPDLSNLNTAKTFSLFHVNIRRLTKQQLKFFFDIIGITESKQTIGMDFALNVNMDGYNIHTRPTKSSHDGIQLGMIYLLSVMSMKHFGLRLKQDQK